MHTSMLLEMAADGYGDRLAIGSKRGGITYAQLLDKAQRAAVWAASRNVTRVGLVDVNTEAVPILLYGAGLAGMPFVPVNYRLADDQLAAILARTAPAVFVVEDPVPGRVGDIEGVQLVTRSQFFAELDAVDADEAAGLAGSVGDPDEIAILLYTSGTTGEPKAAVLRHKHLASYVLSTVEFMSADEDDAALVSVPPYHVAGTSAVLTSVHAGRRLVYLPAFTPEAWVATARDEGATQAMVVPTMLGRVLDVLESEEERLPALRHLSYGGGRMPLPTVERALTLLPHVDFVNAYGLTETSSTAAVLGPDDHREAMASSDPKVRARLQSVGRPIPTLELEIRDAEGKPVPDGEVGEIWIRGEQVAGEYLGRASVMEDGWFPTRDGGYLDEHGYLYLTGRLDDIIVRGAENISPGEIEDVLAAHDAVADAAVVGVPDVEWGEKVVAAVVLADGKTTTQDELKEWVRAELRSSKIPENIEFRAELPYNDTGKLLRRVLKTELGATYGSSVD
jgi:acyl-CoA synthetase (AMP-forming)/AMP-acid ligase II